MIDKVKTALQDEYRRNIILNYLFRFVGLLLGLFSVRVNLSYLGSSLYGLWITIASVVSWMSSGDFGIANGLRNELAKAYGENDSEQQRKLIATAIYSLSKLALVLFAVILIICEILFRTGILEMSVRIPMYITAVFFCVNLTIGISQSVAQSYQKSWLATMTNTAMQFISIFLVVILVVCKIPANLVVFSIVYGVCTLVPNLFLVWILKHKGIVLFSNTKSNFSPELVNSILRIGLQFFGLQLCGLVLDSTDSVIINYLFGSEMVTKYGIITKIYTAGTTLFSILLIALWSAVTYQMAQKNFKWIYKTIKNLVACWIVFTIGVVFVSLIFNPIVRLWIGADAPYYEPIIIVVFGFYCSLTAFSGIFVYVLNGMGVIKLQLYLAIAAAAINIPLSVILARNCGMGILGVKLATTFSAVICGCVMPIQAIYVLKQKEKMA